MKTGIDADKQAQRMNSKADSFAINNNNKTNAFAAPRRLAIVVF